MIDTQYITQAMGTTGDWSLKTEFDNIIRDYGWYIVVRSFDFTRRSTYWDEEAKEAVNGPPWEYTDYLVKARRVEMANTNDEQMSKVGSVYNLAKIFFVKSEFALKREDIIYTIEEAANEIQALPVDVHALEGYNIEEVEQKIESGRIFWKCYCSYLTPRNDETIEGGFQVSYMK